jgi:hypothetical protein
MRHREHRWREVRHKGEIFCWRKDTKEEIVVKEKIQRRKSFIKVYITKSPRHYRNSTVSWEAEGIYTLSSSSQWLAPPLSLNNQHTRRSSLAIEGFKHLLVHPYWFFDIGLQKLQESLPIRAPIHRALDSHPSQCIALLFLSKSSKTTRLCSLNHYNHVYAPKKLPQNSSKTPQTRNLFVCPENKRG